MRKKELFLKIRHEIKKIAEELKPKPIHELRNYVSKEAYDRIDINGTGIDIMIWAEDHGPNRIAVIIDGSRMMVFGMGRHVIAEGFYKYLDGSTADFTETDYYQHGY
jgi:hypothetical protein